MLYDMTAIDMLPPGGGFGNGMFMRRFGLEAEDIVAAVGYEEQVSSVLSMVAAPGGRLWVTRSADGMTPRILEETGEPIVSLYRLTDADSDREPTTESGAAANHPGPWNERETMTGFRLVRPVASDPAEAPTFESHSRRCHQP